jgi:phosphoenolpyruvate carboxykinase (ATP)
VRAITSGALDGAETRVEPVFNLRVPTAVPGVPSAVLNPRSTWPNPEEYDAQAARLKAMFEDAHMRVASGQAPASGAG